MKKLFAGKKWFTLCLCLLLAATGLYLGCKSSILQRERRLQMETGKHPRLRQRQ